MTRYNRFKLHSPQGSTAQTAVDSMTSPGEGSNPRKVKEVDSEHFHTRRRQNISLTDLLVKEEQATTRTRRRSNNERVASLSPLHVREDTIRQSPSIGDGSSKKSIHPAQPLPSHSSSSRSASSILDHHSSDETNLNPNKRHRNMQDEEEAAAPPPSLDFFAILQQDEKESMCVVLLLSLINMFYLFSFSLSLRLTEGTSSSSVNHLNVVEFVHWEARIGEYWIPSPFYNLLFRTRMEDLLKSKLPLQVLLSFGMMLARLFGWTG